MPADDRNERSKALEVAVSQIEKQFGKGSIMRMGAKGAVVPIDAIPTGSISLDFALGIGGVPRGRVVEIFGPESSGKTTLALQVVAQAQKLGGMAAFVDAEHALDSTYAKKLGVELDNLLVSQPDNGEQALEIVEVLVRSGGVDVVVVDSVAALVPRAEIEGEMGEAQMGLQARLMSQALRKLTGVVSKSKTSLVFINQLREKIGVMFGNPETTTGGRALKFYASVRMDIRRIASIKDGDVIIGGRTRVKVVKNKVAPPFREAEFDILYGEGISREGDLLDLAVERKIVDKSGTWFAYGGDRLGQGRENAKQFLRDNPETTQAIEDRLRKELGLTREEAPAGVARSRQRGPLRCKIPFLAGGQVAQLVEHSAENRGVPSSILGLATIFSPRRPAVRPPPLRLGRVRHPPNSLSELVADRRVVLSHVEPVDDRLQRVARRAPGPGSAGRGWSPSRSRTPRGGGRTTAWAEGWAAGVSGRCRSCTSRPRCSPGWASRDRRRRPAEPRDTPREPGRGAR